MCISVYINFSHLLIFFSKTTRTNENKFALVTDPRSVMPVLKFKQKSWPVELLHCMIFLWMVYKVYFFHACLKSKMAAVTVEHKLLLGLFRRIFPEIHVCTFTMWNDANTS